MLQLLVVRAGVVSCPRQDLFRLRAGVFLLAGQTPWRLFLRLLQPLLHQRLLFLSSPLLHQRLPDLLLRLGVSATSTVVAPSMVPFLFDGMVLQRVIFGRLSLLSGRCAAPHRRPLYGG